MGVTRTGIRGSRGFGRTPLRLLAVGIGCLSLLAIPVAGATPNHLDVGVAGTGPSSATWQGAALNGQPDPLGPPSPVCNQSLGCDREQVTVHAPDGFTATNVISITASAAWTDPNSSFDIAILDSTGAPLGSVCCPAKSPATVTVSDIKPGDYTIEVDSDIAFNAAYTGTVSVSSAPRSQQQSHPTGGLGFGRETLADPFRLGTEPNIAVSPDGTIYESPIFGFSTTQSFIQRSDNGGRTFNVLGVPGVGKTSPCPGGGDSDIATTPTNDLYFIDLGGAPVVPANLTADRGNTWTSDCLGNDQNGANNFTDRQWLSIDTKHHYAWYIYRDGLVNEDTPVDEFSGHVYGEYFKHAPLPSAPGTAGLSNLQFTSVCHTATGADAACLSDVQIAGNAVTDNAVTGVTYQAMTFPDGVGIARIDPTAATPVTEHIAAPKANAVLFPTVAVDKAGTVYEAWTSADNYQVYFTVSHDEGTTWSTPVAVNGAPAAVTVMPWIVAGDPGRVDIVFYGSPQTSAPTTNDGPWNAFMLQSLDADQASPAWAQAQMTDRANHVDPICLSGLGCTTDTGPAGDRELGDFFRVALDGNGRAVVSFADGNNKLGQEVAGGPAAAPSFADFVEQASGPSLYASVGDVPAIPQPDGSVSVPQHHDPVPFVSPAGPGPDNAALELLGSSTTVSGGKVKVHLTIANLDPTVAATPPALPVSTYLTRWWYGGQVWYAAAELHGGQWRFYSGQAAPVSDGAAIKYAYYPATNSDTGTVTTGANGTIDITVPASEVGSPTESDTLYSVTSYALTHAAPTAPTPPTASNFNDFPQIADSLPAYNVSGAPAAVLGESPWTPVLLVVGLGCIALGVAGPRRRRRKAAAGGS